MAQLTRTPLSQPQDTPLFFHHLEAVKNPAKLGYLLTGQNSEYSAQAATRFLDYAKSNKLDLKYFYTASADEKGNNTLSAGLIVPCQGKAGMLFLNPLRSNSDSAYASQLIRYLYQQVDPKDINLLQTLLEPRQDLEQKAFQDAEFKPLAKLLYMQRRSKPDDQLTELDFSDQNIELLNWSQANKAHFERAILKSYEATLDCPALVGLRHIDDIIEGHMATGKFDPQLWLALHQNNEPVGVLLLAKLPEQDSLEIVYLGVSDNWRGNSIAKKLVSHAIGLCKQHKLAHLILAVDEINSPAIGLYRGMDFLPSVRKHALIKH